MTLFFSANPSILQHILHTHFALNDILMITRSLSIPWHNVTKKGQDFGPSFTYVGFSWDIIHSTVHVPEDRWLQACVKIDSILSSPTLTCCEVASVLGTLQHPTFVYKDGRHPLSGLSSFLSKFPNNFVKFHLPKPVQNNLAWWCSLLSSSALS